MNYSFAKNLLLSFFQRNFSEFFQLLLQFQRSLAGTHTGSFVSYFSLQSSIFRKCLNKSRDIFH